MIITALENYEEANKNIFLDTNEEQNLLNCTLSNPHDSLGKHPLETGHVIRVYDRAACAIEVVINDKSYPMHNCHTAGLFVCHLEGFDCESQYQLRKNYNGETSLTNDPYSFLPQIGELDLHLITQGKHQELHKLYGSTPITVDGIPGVRFLLWAPNADRVSVVGHFNSWDGRRHMMRNLGPSGIWEIFIPQLDEGELYKYEILTKNGTIISKQDPYANGFELRPGTASRVVDATKFSWSDDEWLKKRASIDPQKKPLSIYEVHLGSWRIQSTDNFPNYRDLAHELCDYVKDMGYTHIELLPVTEHPFDQSWGYQTTGYFAPTSRFGSFDDFAYFVNHFHKNDIGVILDWAPAHFPKDEVSIGRYDGTALYEHEDPRQGEHLDWGTFIFNFGRNEVKNFLLSSALFWLDALHLDGIRVDAVSSMLYRDYSRPADQWVPNQYGGNENLEAIDFVKELNTLCHDKHPGCMIIAEESTAYPKVSYPIYEGGLGFTMKWNMGWMHDFLNYFSQDTIYRKYHQNDITFALSYAFNENFVLPLSHDEVVHGKGSLINKMPGDYWQKFANLRSLYAIMFAHPGKKLLFMGCEIAQWSEWNCNKSLDWDTLNAPAHAGIQTLVKDLNHLYRQEPALWQEDGNHDFFQWIDFSDHEQSVISFVRWDSEKREPILVVANFTPVLRHDYRIGVPKAGVWQCIFNSDSSVYDGSNCPTSDLQTEQEEAHGLEQSIKLSLPPLGVSYFKLKE